MKGWSDHLFGVEIRPLVFATDSNLASDSNLADSSITSFNQKKSKRKDIIQTPSTMDKSQHLRNQYIGCCKMFFTSAYTKVRTIS